MAIPSGAVLVGYDGSAGSRLALDWAAAQAPHLARPLAVLVVEEDVSLVVARDTGVRARMDALVAEVYEELYRRAVDDIWVELVAGPARHALLEAASLASMLVLGERRHRRSPVISVGSVSRAAVALAPCPLVVAHPPRDPVSRTVVVGLGTHTTGRHALTFGLELASRHDLSVLAMLAGRRQAPADRALSEELDGWAERYPDITLSRRVVPGNPLRALTAASRHANLAVVGYGGRRQLPGRSPDPVSRRLLQRAHCPVAVVP